MMREKRKRRLPAVGSAEVGYVCESRWEVRIGAKHYVYLLESVNAPAQNYVGRTDDLRARLADHNAGKSPHTAKYRPWNLVCYHAFADRDRAAALERYLKTGSGREFRRRHFGA